MEWKEALALHKPHVRDERKEWEKHHFRRTAEIGSTAGL